MTATAVTTFVTICSRLAPMASVALCLAPLPTLQRVKRNRSVGDLPLLPYSSMVSNAYIWVAYGAVKQSKSIWLANSVGLVMGLYYFASFIRFSPPEATTLPGSIEKHVQVMIVTSAATSAVAGLVKPNRAAAIIGMMGVVMCMALFASPLAALSHVLKTKSAKSIPLPFTLATAVNCFLWSVTGIHMKDWNIIIPNAVGLLLSMIQVGLKTVFREESSKTIDLPI